MLEAIEGIWVGRDDANASRASLGGMYGAVEMRVKSGAGGCGKAHWAWCDEHEVIIKSHCKGYVG